MKTKEREEQQMLFGVGSEPWCETECLSIMCPTCKAEIGKRCRTKTGRLKWAHPSRMYKAPDNNLMPDTKAYIERASRIREDHKYRLLKSMTYEQRRILGFKDFK